MKAGFTVVETIIVLGIVAIIVMFSVPGVSQSCAYHKEQLFWSELRQNWRAAQLRARDERQVTQIEYEQDGNQIIFTAGSKQDVVHLPGTIQVIRFEPFQMHENGYVKPQTQEFKSSLTGRHYLMRIQLAWGGYHVESVNEK
ncbi:hypothetical protein FD27_GL001562 [Limosilactobacillus frumenti DSM 13145]|uniref:Uncharacterized protein n=1 Tax=Limosilactobacillus frumenti DSM 13145 TaxID=1423746 RepID=A0A0R1PD98_9LACO|nr:type II secretion system protein [Limosilactobacillus frumenti]KRL28564.1 hypothetical protein FD27_GL001562 [Limosilactobacillus frumenti DSM 13145]MBA2914524.1 type II secretion system protein [Limosilactobacillus frumenti]QFG72366.1 type II secretion system protein [Limosilactobacillus frumenti]